MEIHNKIDMLEMNFEIYGFMCWLPAWCNFASLE